MTDRSTDRPTAGPDKRRVILAAAVRVFAEKGYHTCRVGDIAEEAGIAHGLLYHYFASKEEVLETVFRENWRDLLNAFVRIEASDEPPPAQLAGIAKVLLRAWRDRPDLVTVMVREVARSPQLQGQVDEIKAGFMVIQRVIERGQEDGSFRPELDARLASWIFYGGLEELLTGWVLGQLPDGDEEVARAERTVVDLVCGGLAAVAPVQPSGQSCLAAKPVGLATHGHAASQEREAPNPVVEDVERRRRTASWQHDGGVAGALATHERAVDGADARRRVAQSDPPGRPPAGRLVEREHGSDAAFP